MRELKNHIHIGYVLDLKEWHETGTEVHDFRLSPRHGLGLHSSEMLRYVTFFS